MRIAISADTLPGIAPSLAQWVRDRGHSVLLHGALAEGDNALGISLRLTSASQMQEMLDAWFSSSTEASQAANIDHVKSLDAGSQVTGRPA